MIYPVNTFAILAGLVILMAIIINIAFQINFNRKFDSKRVPLKIERKIRLGKMTRQEAQQFLEPVDDKFNNYKLQHKSTTYIVYVLSSTLGYKFNKLFYSFFYDLKMFEAHISDASYYRKMMTAY